MKNPAFTQIAARTCMFALDLVLSLAGVELAVRHLRLAPELGYLEKWRVRLSPNPSEVVRILVRRFFAP